MAGVIGKCFSEFRECAEKQEAGSPCYLKNGSTIFVKRAETPNSKKEFKEIREQIYGLFPDEKLIDSDKVWAHWLSEYGVVGWEKLNDDDGNPVEFTRENARAVFLETENWLSLNRLLQYHAVNYENYLKDAAEGDLEAIKKS